MEFVEVYPRIHVYKNLYDDISKLFDYVKIIEQESNGLYIFEKWKDWFTFGTYGSAHGSFMPQEVSQETAEREDYCFNKLYSATEQAVNHYVEYYGIDLPENSFITRPNVAKYFDESVLPPEHTTADKDNLRMQFHTDYPIAEWYWPGRKFLITCNTYINDDYDGGEIIFLHSDNIIPVKPEAGDVVVFPSGSPLFPEAPEREPYFHAVNSNINGEKYFTRSYLQYDTSDMRVWDEKRSQFNSEEEWNDQINKEVKGGHNTASVYMGDPPPGASEPGAVIEDMDEIMFRLDRYKPGDKFWISMTPLARELYDISHKDNYVPRPDHCVPDSD